MVIIAIGKIRRVHVDSVGGGPALWWLFIKKNENVKSRFPADLIGGKPPLPRGPPTVRWLTVVNACRPRVAPTSSEDTNAHPLVEIPFMDQPAKICAPVDFANVSCHSSTGCFPPLATGSVQVDVLGSFTHAQAVKLGAALAVSPGGDRTVFTPLALDEYEVVVLE